MAMLDMTRSIRTKIQTTINQSIDMHFSPVLTFDMALHGHRARSIECGPNFQQKVSTSTENHYMDRKNEQG